MKNTTVDLPPLPDCYSADIVRSDGQRHRIYVDGEKQRTDSFVGDICQTINISRPDLAVNYMLTPRDNRCIVVQRGTNNEADTFSPDEHFTWAIAGDETVDGMACIKYEGRFIPRPEYVAKVVFVDRASQLRVKTQTFDRNGKAVLCTELKNIVLQPPSPAVFNVPSEYRCETIATK